MDVLVLHLVVEVIPGGSPTISPLAVVKAKATATFPWEDENNFKTLSSWCH